MNRREFLSLGIGLAAIVALPNLARGQYRDENNDKVRDDLEEMLNNGTYKRYMRLEGIASVIILYYNTPSDEDIKAIYNLSRQPMVIDNVMKTIIAGLPKNSVVDYAKRKNVMMIIPDPVKE